MEKTLSLTKEQQEKAIQHLNKKWTNKTCPVCQGNTWDVHPELYEMRQFNGGDMVLGGPLIPLLVVECKNCGNTISINAMRAGVISPEKKGEHKDD